MSKLPTQTLGDLIEVKHGFAFNSQYFADSGPYVLLTPGNFYDGGGFKARESQKHYNGPVPEAFVLNAGDLLVAMTEQGEGLLGSAAIVPYDRTYLHNQRLGLIRPREGAEVDLRFVYYLFNSQAVRQQIRASASGAKIRHTAPMRIYDVKVPAVHVGDQRRIASILGAYDDLIEVNRRRVALLEGMARGLFEEWFIRFRFPRHEAVPVVDAPDGPLPAGWNWVPFSQLAQFINGYAFKPSDFEDAGLPVIKIPELKNGISVKTPRNSGKNVPAQLFVDDGDLLFSWSGTLAISEWIGGPGLLNQHLFLVVPKAQVSRAFLREALRAALPRFELQGVGATMKHIRRSALDNVCVALPSDEAMVSRADAAFMSFYKEIVVLRLQNANLASSRDLLLPRLLSGQLSVTAAERELEDAA